MLPESDRWAERHRADKKRVLVMEFKTFLKFVYSDSVSDFMSGRRRIFRILNRMQTAPDRHSTGPSLRQTTNSR